MKLSLFDFEVPKNLIAQNPISPRDSSRLLHVAGSHKIIMRDYSVTDLPLLFTPGDLIIFNNTRVIPARLVGHKMLINKTVGIKSTRIEITLHRQASYSSWHAFARPAKKINVGDSINFGPNFSAKVIEKLNNGEVILLFEFSKQEFKQHLSKYGFLPLPPYIKRNNVEIASDKHNYQTIFASHDGAVAAPTAGLHFTPSLVNALKTRGVTIAQLTLHVGAGTFLPVKTTDTNEHIMHAEWGEITNDTARIINETRKKGKKIIACGTTVLRLIESIANDEGWIKPFTGETNLFIRPGYHFKTVNTLLTNFHLPKSTLFMLVAAFSGLDRIQKAYNHAISNNYRFYSYGDCCLLDRNNAETQDDSI